MLPMFGTSIEPVSNIRKEPCFRLSNRVPKLPLGLSPLEREGGPNLAYRSKLNCSWETHQQTDGDANHA